MLTKSPKQFSELVAIHEAANRTAAVKLRVAVDPPVWNRGVCRYAGDVLTDWPDGPEEMERVGLVLLCGLAALLHVGDCVNCRDDVEAMELVWESIEEYPGHIKANPSALRQYRARVAELQAEATAMVTALWPETERRQ